MMTLTAPMTAIDRLRRIVIGPRFTASAAACLALLAIAAGGFLLARPSAFSLAPTTSLQGLAIAAVWLAILWGGSFAAPLTRIVGVVAARLVMSLLFVGAIHPPGTDAGNFLLLADSLRSGTGLVLDGRFAQYPPLLPIFLATAPAWLVNNLCDLGSAQILRRLSPRYGDRAAWLFLMWPGFLLSSAVPQKESLIILLFLALIHWQRRPALFGLVAGLLALTQPLLAPLPFVGLALKKRWPAPATILAWTAVLMPWWIRNFLVLGSFVPLTTSSGLSFYVGVTGRYDLLDHFYSLGELAGNREAARTAAQLLVSAPLDALINRAQAFGQGFGVEDFAVIRMQWMGFDQPLALFTLSTQLSYCSLLVVAAFSSYRSPWLSAALISLVLFGLPFEFAERHRYLLTPLLCLMAAQAIASLQRSAVRLPFGVERPARC